MPPRRILVDSRFAKYGENGNQPPSRFRVTFPEPVEYLSAETELRVTDFACTMTLPTFNATCFELLLTEYTTGGGYTSHLITFPHGQNTADDLRTILEQLLNSTGAGTYAVTLTSSLNRLTVTGSGAAGFGFRLWGDADVRDPRFRDIFNSVGGGGVSYVPEATCARVFGIPSLGLAGDLPGLARILTELSCEHLDTRGCDTIPLVCPELSRNDTISAYGSRDVIRKIPMSEPHGGILQGSPPSVHEDYVQIGRSSFRELNFRLVDAYGTVLSDLQGSCNFTLVFSQY
jgi:hypothetical protein